MVYNIILAQPCRDGLGGLRRAVVALRSQVGLEVINKHKNRQHLLSYGIETRAQPKEH